MSFKALNAQRKNNFKEKALKVVNYLEKNNTKYYYNYKNWLEEIAAGKIPYSKKYNSILDGLLKIKPKNS